MSLLNLQKYNQRHFDKTYGLKNYMFSLSSECLSMEWSLFMSALRRSFYRNIYLLYHVEKPLLAKVIHKNQVFYEWKSIKILDYEQDYGYSLYFKENAESLKELKDLRLMDTEIWKQKQQIMDIIWHLFNEGSRRLSSDSWEEIFDTLEGMHATIHLSSWQSLCEAFAVN